MKYFILSLLLAGTISAQIPTLDLALTQPIVFEDGRQSAKVEIVTDGIAHNGLNPDILITGGAVDSIDYFRRGRRFMEAGKQQLAIIFIGIDNDIADAERDIIITLRGSQLPGRYNLGAITQVRVTISDDDVANVVAPQTNLASIANGDDRIDLSWNLGQTYDEQQIYYSTDDADTQDEFTLLARVTGAAAVFSHTQGLGQTNRYLLRATVGIDESDPSNISRTELTTEITIPADPSLMVLTAISHTQIDGSFQDNSSNEDSFFVDYQVNGGGFVFSIPLSANLTSFTIVGLTAGDVVDARVKATNASGSSGLSNTDQATTPALDLGPVVALTVNGTSVSSFVIAWTVVATPDNIILEYANNSSFVGSTFVSLELSGATNIHAVTGWNSQDLIWVRVAQKDGGQTGQFSQVDATPTLPGAPGTPILSVSPLDTVSLLSTWDDQGADSYRVQWGIGNFNFFKAGIVGLQFTIPGLQAATTYQVRVRGESAPNIGEYSDTVIATTFGIGSGGLTATASGLTVSLQAGVVPGAVAYRFERKDCVDCLFVEITNNLVDPPDSDLLMRLPLDEGSGTTAFDISGNGNNGTLLNGAAFESNSGDGSARSVRFDGVNDFIDVGVVDVNGSALTLAAWFNADGFGDDPRIISKSSGSAANDHVFMLSTITAGAEERLRGRVRIGGSTTTLIASSGNLAIGQWHHSALTYDGSVLRLYLDAILVGSTSLSGAVDIDAAISVAVGSQSNGTAQHFDGLIDDVRILQRALNAGELLGIVNGMPAGNSFVDSDYGSRMYIPTYARPNEELPIAIILAGGSKVYVSVINPSNGPGTSFDQAYSDYIDDLEAVGVRAHMYVFSSFGGRPIADVKADISTAYAFYPKLKGIFQDEIGLMSSNNGVGGGSQFTTLADSLAYYNEVLAHLRSIDPDGEYVMNNGGQRPLTFMAEDYAEISSPVTIYENRPPRWLDPSEVRPSWYSNYPSSQFTLLLRNDGIAFNTKDVIDKMKKEIHVGYVHLDTSLLEETTWRLLPNNWDEMLSTISLLPDSTELFYRVRAEFSGGSLGVYSPIVSVTTGLAVVPPDNILPLVVISCPDDITVPEGSSIDVQIEATDNDGTVSRVELFVNGVSQGIDTIQPYMVVWDNFPAGFYSLTAAATDNEGGVGVSSSVTVTVTTTSGNLVPIVTITNPLDGANIDTGIEITVTADAVDLDGFINEVIVRAGVTELSRDTTAPYEATWNPAAGSYVLIAEAIDDAGASVISSAVNVTINTVTPPPPPPGFDPAFIIPDDGTFANLFLNQGAMANLGPGTDIMVRQDYDEDVGDRLRWANGSGEPGQPIRVFAEKPWTNEIFHNGNGRNAIVEMGSQNDKSKHDISLIGLILYNSQTDRTSSQSGANPSDIDIGYIYNDYGFNNKLILCYLHDGQNTIGLWDTTGSEVSHCIIMNSGWRAPGRDEGVSVYVQTKPSSNRTKFNYNAILEGYHHQFQFQHYGSPSAAVSDLDVIGNFFTQKAVLFGGEGNGGGDFIRDNIFFNAQCRLGFSGGIRTGDEFTDNILYFLTTPPSDYGHLSHTQSWFFVPAVSTFNLQDVIFSGNEVVMDDGAGIVHQIGVINDGDRSNFLFSNNRWSPSDGDYEYNIGGSDQSGKTFSNFESRFSPSGDVAVATDKSTTTFHTWPVAEWPSTAMIQVLNRGSLSTVQLPASEAQKFLAVGQKYEVYNCHNIEGGVVLAGTFSNDTIPLQMAGRLRTSPLQVDAPVNWDIPPPIQQGVFMIFGELVPDISPPFE